MTATTTDFLPGGYRYMPGVFQYAGGVAALPGWRIERARFMTPVPLAAGFDRIASVLKQAGRPLTAFCACELQSPAPFTEDGFKAVNPVARANTCPAVAPPDGPAFHAFCYTVPASDAAPSFVVAGSGEAPEGKGNYRDHIIALGDTTPDGLRRKAVWVLGEMERRMDALGGSWQSTTAVQAYTVHDLYPFLADEIGRRGALRQGLTWHLNRPPVQGIDFEMDCRAIAVEHMLTA